MAKNNNLNTRKSQIDIQFNWIFVIVAGAIILLFFASIVYKQFSKSEASVSRKVIDLLDAIFTGSEVSTSTARPIGIPDIDINLICDNTGMSEFEIAGTGSMRAIPSTPFFAPNKLKGNTITTWALDWSVPFKVTNFLFITSPKVRYYFVGDDTYNLLSYLPPDNMMTKEKINPQDISSLNDKNNYKVRFIILDPLISTITLPSFFSNIDVSAIKITNEEIIFYKRKGLTFETEGTVNYITKTELYAAIFTEDFTSYKCNMRKAFKRLEYVSQVYGGRALTLNIGACNYDLAVESLSSMNSLAKNCYSNMGQCSFSDLKNAAENLKIKNNQLEYASCPLIY